MKSKCWKASITKKRTLKKLVTHKAINRIRIFSVPPDSKDHRSPGSLLHHADLLATPPDPTSIKSRNIRTINFSQNG